MHSKFFGKKDKPAKDLTGLANKVDSSLATLGKDREAKKAAQKTELVNDFIEDCINDLRDSYKSCPTVDKFIVQRVESAVDINGKELLKFYKECPKDVKKEHLDGLRKEFVRALIDFTEINENDNSIVARHSLLQIVNIASVLKPLIVERLKSVSEAKRELDKIIDAGVNASTAKDVEKDAPQTAKPAAAVPSTAPHFPSAPEVRNLQPSSYGTYNAGARPTVAAVRQSSKTDSKIPKQPAATKQSAVTHASQYSSDREYCANLQKHSDFLDSITPAMTEAALEQSSNEVDAAADREFFSDVESREIRAATAAPYRQTRSVSPRRSVPAQEQAPAKQTSSQSKNRDYRLFSKLLREKLFDNLATKAEADASENRGLFGGLYSTLTGEDTKIEEFERSLYRKIHHVLDQATNSLPFATKHKFANLEEGKKLQILSTHFAEGVKQEGNMLVESFDRQQGVFDPMHLCSVIEANLPGDRSPEPAAVRSSSVPPATRHVTAQMQRTQEALPERGEAVDGLGRKTGMLANQATDYNRHATLLLQQVQVKGMGWGK